MCNYFPAQIPFSPVSTSVAVAARNEGPRYQTAPSSRRASAGVRTMQAESPRHLAIAHSLYRALVARALLPNMPLGSSGSHVGSGLSPCRRPSGRRFEAKTQHQFCAKSRVFGRGQRRAEARRQRGNAAPQKPSGIAHFCPPRRDSSRRLSGRVEAGREH